MRVAKGLAAALLAISFMMSLFQSPRGAGDNLVAIVLSGSLVLGWDIGRVMFVCNHP
jgi:hypothetical protein